MNILVSILQQKDKPQEIKEYRRTYSILKIDGYGIGSDFYFLKKAVPSDKDDVFICATFKVKNKWRRGTSSIKFNGFEKAFSIAWAKMKQHKDFYLSYEKTLEQMKKEYERFLFDNSIH